MVVFCKSATNHDKLVEEVGGEAESKEGLPREKHVVAPGLILGRIWFDASKSDQRTRLSS